MTETATEIPTHGYSPAECVERWPVEMRAVMNGADLTDYHETVGYALFNYFASGGDMPNDRGGEYDWIWEQLDRWPECVALIEDCPAQ